MKNNDFNKDNYKERMLTFDFPAELAETLLMILLDVGWLRQPEQLKTENPATGRFRTIYRNQRQFLKRYNDPYRPRFTQEMLDECLAGESAKSPLNLIDK